MSKKLTDHEKDKGCWFSVVSHDEEQRKLLKERVKEFKFWAWIDHKPDIESVEEDSHFHSHFMIGTNATRSVKQISDSLEISSNFIQKVRYKRAYGRYFIHLDNPEKIQYTISDIHSNKRSMFEIWKQDIVDSDVTSLFKELSDLKLGFTSVDDFIKNHYYEFQSMPFYQRLRLVDLLSTMYCQDKKSA